jgi:GDP-4-dehydro-6-deoxy-D-mannose reductase
MRVLVTGGAGFVGRHLIRELQGARHEAAALCLPGESPPEGVEALRGDVTVASELGAAIERYGPDACVHLAGISSVPRSWEDPRRAFAVNLGGTLNLLEAARDLRPAMRVLVVSSAHVYGEGFGERTIDEEAPLRPSSPYAISKAAADLTSGAYAARFRLEVLTVRPTNHIGPGQSLDFVVPAMAAQLASIVSGRAEGPIRCGNLDSRRDFLDVRDVVRGYRLLLERGRAGRIYHVAGGPMVRIGDVFEGLCALAGVRPSTEVDRALWRPTDASPKLDASRMRTELGWVPEIPLERTLRDIWLDILERT